MRSTIERRPSDPGRFGLVEPAVAGGEVRLLASYSEAAGEYFWPARRRCPLTTGAVHDVLLDARGTLWTWSYVNVPWSGLVSPSASDGYGVGLIDLPEGPRVVGVLIGERGEWEIGTKMVGVSLDFVERDGAMLCLLAFRYAERG